MFVLLFRKRYCYKVPVAERGPEDGDALLVCWQGPIAFPGVGTGGRTKDGEERRRFFTCLVPYSGFAKVDLDVGSLAQGGGNRGEQGPSPLRRAGEVDVIQVGKEVLAGLELTMHPQQGGMLAHGIQGGHEWVSLLPSFSLLDVVGFAFRIIEKIRSP